MDTGPEKEMALTLQCQMPRKVAGVRLKVFRLFLLLLGLGSPRWVSQKSKEPPSWGAESDAPCPEGSTLMPTGEGPLQVSCAAGHHMCMCVQVCVCVCVGLRGGCPVSCQGRAVPQGWRALGSRPDRCGVGPPPLSKTGATEGQEETRVSR